MKRNYFFMLFLSLALLGVASCQKKLIDLHSFDFKQLINAQYAKCNNLKRPAVIHKTIFFDFDKDGNDEAIIEASPCGSDEYSNIVDIYRSSAGKIEKIVMDDNHGFFKGENIYRGIIGKRYSSVSMENEEIVLHYSDESGLQNRLIVHYIWTGREFSINRVVQAPTFKPSYNCNQASTNQEKMICANKNLAELDVKMDVIYSKFLEMLKNSNKTDAARQDQKKWLVTRDKTCPLNPQISRCLVKQYWGRMNVLTNRYYMAYLNNFRQTQTFHIPTSILKIEKPNYSINNRLEWDKYRRNKKSDDEKFARALLEGIAKHSDDANLMIVGIGVLVMSTSPMTADEKEFLLEYVVANHMDYIHTDNCYNCGEYDSLAGVTLSLATIYLRKDENIKAYALLSRALKHHEHDISVYLLGDIYWAYARSLWGVGRRSESIRFLQMKISSYTGGRLFQLQNLLQNYKSVYGMVRSEK